MKISQQAHGFILVTTLIFILIFSMLAYQSLESALLEIKLHQVVKNQKFLYDKAQGNLESSEKDLKKHCSLYDSKNRNNCSIVRSQNDEIFNITSTASRGGMTVIVQSTCAKQTRDGECKRQSWQRVM